MAIDEVSISSVDEVLTRTKIPFREPLSLEQTEQLMDYIARNLPANVNYHAGYFKKIYPWSDGRISSDLGTVDLEGMIRSKRELMGFDSFRSEHGRNTSQIVAIQFITIPEYELYEYRPEVVRLWNDVGAMVSKFFDERKAK